MTDIVTDFFEDIEYTKELLMKIVNAFEDIIEIDLPLDLCVRLATEALVYSDFGFNTQCTEEEARELITLAMNKLSIANRIWIGIDLMEPGIKLFIRPLREEDE